MAWRAKGSKSVRSSIKFRSDEKFSYLLPNLQTEQNMDFDPDLIHFDTFGFDFDAQDLFTDLPLNSLDFEPIENLVDPNQHWSSSSTWSYSPKSESSSDEDWISSSKPESKKRKYSTSECSSLSSDEETCVVAKRRRKKSQNRTSPNIVHWLLTLLQDPNNEDMIAWTDFAEGEFKIVNQDKLGQLWGIKKQNPKMTYNNVARTMRYHYGSKGQELQIVHRKLMYKFSKEFLDANTRA